MTDDELKARIRGGAAYSLQLAELLHLRHAYEELERKYQRLVRKQQKAEREP